MRDNSLDISNVFFGRFINKKGIRERFRNLIYEPEKRYIKAFRSILNFLRVKISSVEDPKAIHFVSHPECFLNFVKGAKKE